MDYQYSDITRKIIGCAVRVHNTIGNGFQEIIYQRCLAIELAEAGLTFVREQEVPLFYKGREVGTRRVDFLIENTVLVELKATAEITEMHYAQMLNYLTAYQLEVGLLINFGEKSLRFNRLVNTRKY